MFNPFPGRSQEFFRGSNARRITNQQSARNRAAISAVSGAANNSAFVASARRAAQYQRARQNEAQDAAAANQRSANTFGLIGAGIGAAGGIAAAIIA